MVSKSRSALVRILVDLVKADGVIDEREMDRYKVLKTKFGITDADESIAASMTLSEAVAELVDGTGSCINRTELESVFRGMVQSDGYCPRDEALLMAGINYALDLDETGVQADVISVQLPCGMLRGDTPQIIYVEAAYNHSVNAMIEKSMREISIELRLGGFDFVYIPEIIRHYESVSAELLNNVIRFLSPGMSAEYASKITDRLRHFTTATFCTEQLHHKLGFAELDTTPPALLVPIGQSTVGGEVYSNFLRICIPGSLTAEPAVTDTVRNFIDTVMRMYVSDRCLINPKVDSDGRFLYHGFYRQLFDILLLQRPVRCELCIDTIRGVLSFPEVSLTIDRLHRKERALFTLFVYESLTEDGISFNPPTNSKSLDKYKARMALLSRRYAYIYEIFGGDPDKVPDISRQDIRLPMIAGIKRAICALKPKVFDAERFIVTRNKTTGIYAISATADMFVCVEGRSVEPVPVIGSRLFENLAAIR